MFNNVSGNLKFLEVKAIHIDFNPLKLTSTLCYNCDRSVVTLEVL